MSIFCVPHLIRVRCALVAFFSAGVLLTAAAAASAEGTAGGAAPYLRQGLGARALGMGNAQAAAVSDASAAYWNPAALVQLENMGIASQTSILGEDRSWNFLNFCQSSSGVTGLKHAYGISWINFSAGQDLERRDSNRPEALNTFGDSQNTFVGSVASQVSHTVAVGLNGKIITQTLDNESAYGLGWDLAVWQDLGAVAWGLAWQDMYSYLDWGGRRTDRLPALWRAGAVWEILENQLRVTADGSMEYSSTRGAQTPGYHLGAEYLPWEWLAVRLGVDQGRPAGGLGFKVRLGSRVRARVDYALSAEQLPGAGLTHLFSLIVDILPKPKP